MRTWLYLLVLLCSSITSFSQASLKGKVTDGQQNLLFATVLLLNPDSSLVKGAVTDEKGKFIFKPVTPGRYLIASYLLGYSRFVSQLIQMETENIIMPEITLQETATALSEVEVKAQKPVFEQRMDKLVMNMESSVTSSGNTLLEILQKSPGIVVNRQTNSIMINGRSGVQVMIDGKLMALPPDVMVGLLEGMSASKVEKIEFITTPPAKYDAGGNAGIIHIVTKDTAKWGTSASFGLTAGFRWAEALGANANLNHQGKKMSWFIDYSIFRNHNLHHTKLTRQVVDHDFIQTVKGDSHRENVTTQQSLNAGFEWKLSQHTSLNFGFTAYRRNWDLTALTNDKNRFTTDSTVSTRMQIHESNIWQSGAGAIGLQTSISKKSSINLNLDYLYYRNDNPSSYDSQTFYEQQQIQEVSRIDLKKTTPIRFLVGKADYQYNFSPVFVLEAGLKAVTSQLANNVLVQCWANEAWTIDPLLTSYATLREQIGAIYISGNWQPAADWQVNSGLRYEFTHTAISTPTEKNLVNRKYGYIFPSLSLKKVLNKEKDLQLSYVRRITRPTYNDIAPYVFFWGPNTLSSGNTSLCNPFISFPTRLKCKETAHCLSW